jgi:hypothetical protein
MENVDLVICAKCSKDTLPVEAIDVYDNRDFEGCWLCFKCAKKYYIQNIRWNNQWLKHENSN